MKTPTILLTGATGHMGTEVLHQLYAHENNYNIHILALPSRKDKRKLKPLLQDERVKVIWGDLRNFEDVKKAVKGTDYVLHVGALVSPVADRHPELAWEINFGGTKNIVDARLE